MRQNVLAAAALCLFATHASALNIRSTVSAVTPDVAIDAPKLQTGVYCPVKQIRRKPSDPKECALVEVKGGKIEITPLEQEFLRPDAPLDPIRIAVAPLADNLVLLEAGGIMQQGDTKVIMAALLTERSITIFDLTSFTDGEWRSAAALGVEFDPTQPAALPLITKGAPADIRAFLRRTLLNRFGSARNNADFLQTFMTAKSESVVLHRLGQSLASAVSSEALEKSISEIDDAIRAAIDAE